MFPLSLLELYGRMKGVTEDMGMLKSIGLENYKCFKDETTINIAPLTVLCGVNSSGKSSILKSLLMLKQSYENESPYNEMLFTGEYVDNGFFDDIIYHDNINDIADSDTFKISNTFILRDNSDNNGYSLRKRQDSSSFRELKRIYRQKYRPVDCFEMKITVEVAKHIHKEKSLSSYIENNYIKKFLLEINPKHNDSYTYDRASTIRITKTNSSDNRNYSICYEHLPNNYGIFQDGIFTCTCYFSKMHLSNIYQKEMNDNVKAIRPILLSVCNIVALQYSGIDFIAPLRHNPERSYLIKGNVDSVGITGEDMPILLAKIKDNSIWTDLYCPYREKSGVMNSSDRYKFTYGELLQQWMNYLELGRLELQGNGAFVNLNISGHNIVDVGFGVSQTLPILLQGIYMCPDQTLLLEQPEIHLHPQMQLGMADFLITLAKHERNIILETHSDHIVNRIIKRVMETPDLVDKNNPIVRIIFLDKQDSVSPQKIDIQVDKYKGVMNGTKNFFTQFGLEQMDIAKTGYENHKRDLVK